MNEQVITINGKPYSFEAGETILDVARRVGIYIPTLCHLSGTTNTGACRVCVVEVAGMRNLAASCAMPASNGMSVLTDSPRVIAARRLVVALLMVSGNHNCAARGSGLGEWTDFQLSVMRQDGSDEICDAYGRCTLQELAYRFQSHETIAAYRLENVGSVYNLEDVNPYIIRDFSRCILCGRCVKACQDVQVNNALSYGYRGMHAKIVTGGDVALAESDCVFCGECVQACPVGALVEKDTRYRTRFWDVKRVASTCGGCSTGCAIYIYMKDDTIVRIEGDERHPVNRGSLCAKGRYGFGYMNADNRLTVPHERRGSEHLPVSWEKAMHIVCDGLRRIIQDHGPDAVAGIASAGCLNEDIYAMQRFFRSVVGTNNIDNTARLVDAASLYALRNSIGLTGMVDSLSDIDASDCIVLVGADLTVSHPVIAAKIKRAVRRGVNLIVIDPRLTAIAKHASHHLRPKPGTDAALIYALMHVMFTEGLVDMTAVTNRYRNIAALKTIVEKFPPERIESIAGIPAEACTKAARTLAASKKGIFLFSSGIMQQKFGSATMKTLADLAMLCSGDAAKPRLNALRGLANAQGACDMGCVPDILPGYVPMNDDTARDHLGALWEGTIPHKTGLSILEIMNGVQEGRIKALFLMGADILPSIPYLSGIEEALAKLELFVVHDILMTDTARAAGIVLPAVSLAEADGTITATDRRVQRVRRAVKPKGEAREGWRIFRDLSLQMGREWRVDSSKEVFNEIARVVRGYDDLSHDGLDAGDTVRYAWSGTSIIESNKRDIPPLSFHAEEPALPSQEDDRFSLIPLHVVKEYTDYTGELDPIKKRAAIMNPSDAQAIGVDDGDTVRITSSCGSVTVRVELDIDVKEKTFYLPMHAFKERMNQLIPFESDAMSGTPAYKSCTVKIEKA